MRRFKHAIWSLAALLIVGVALSRSATAQTFSTLGSYNPKPATIETLPEIVYQPWQKTELGLALPVLLASERTDFQDDSVNGPQKIGIHRDIPFSMIGNISSKLTWHHYKNGIVAYVTISSLEAKSIRAQLDIVLPANSQLVFYGLDEQDDRFALDTLTTHRKRLEEDQFWTPSALGESIGVEIRLPSNSDISKLQISILKVSHRFRSTQDENLFALELVCDNHSEAACGVDAGTINANTVDSTVKLVWEDASYAYLCTGALMNVDDGPDVYRPYVLTAAHCISDESEANSLVVHWFYETSSCASTSTSSAFTRTFGGADVLETRTQEDMTLLELERDPPERAYYAGWSTSDVSRNTSVNGAHHPDGVFKKYFLGTSQGSQTTQVCTDENQEDCFTLVQGIRVTVTEGAVEGGSSGSGLFEEVSGEEVLVGILSATHEGCTDQTAFFGRFENFYPHITTWFDPVIDDSDPGDPDEPPEDDHGDTSESATVLVIGEMTEGELETSGDVDVFKFTVDRRGVLTVYTEGSTDTEGSVYNSDNSVEESDDDSGDGWNFKIEVTIDPGTYYVEVSGWGDSTGQYELYSSFVVFDDHGDDEETATEISSSATSWNYDTPGKINEAVDVDVFKIETKHDSRITVYTEGSTDTIGSLKYENGDLVEENDDSTVDDKNFHISEVFESGIYYLFVDGRLEELEEDEEEDEDAGTYQLKVVITTE